MVLVFAEYLVAWMTHDFQIIIELVSFWYVFFYVFLAAPRPTLGHYRGSSLIHPMLITCTLDIRPEGHREPCNEVGSLGLAERLVRFEPGTFRFWSQRLNPLDQSPQMKEWRSAKDIFYTRVASSGLFFIFHWMHLFIDWKNPFYLHHLVDLYSIWWMASALNTGRHRALASWYV